MKEQLSDLSAMQQSVTIYLHFNASMKKLDAYYYYYSL